MTRWQPDAQGRLRQAAITLYSEQGFEATTVAEIAERAGLTKRTFFRYFADKREVLFDATDELSNRWLSAVAAAPPGAEPLTAATAGYDSVAEMFAPMRDYAAIRAQIIMANPELQERELIKLQKLAFAIKSALMERGTPLHAAILAAQMAVTVFHVAFARWVEGDGAGASFRELMDQSLEELREVVSAAGAALT